MPLPAGTGMDRRSFLLRSARAMLSVYGAGAAASAPSKRASRRRGRTPPNSRAGLDLHGRRLGRALGARAGERSHATTNCARPWALRRRTALASPRTTPDVAPAGRASRRSTARQGAASSRRSATTRPTRATSRAVTTGRSASSRSAPPGWMGRYLDVGTAATRCRACRWTTRWRLRSPRRQVPVAAVSSPSDYDFWAYGLGPARDQHATSFGALGRACRDSPAMRAGAAARRADGHHPRAARAVRRTTKPGLPTSTRTRGAQRQLLAALAAMIGRRAADQVRVAVGRRRLRHPLRRGRNARDEPPRTVESVLAFQRDLEARGLDDRVLIQLWSEFGRRPEENGSGTDHGAAGLAFLIGSRRRQHGRRIPRARPRSTPQENLQHQRLPRDVLHAARGLAGRGRRADHPRRRLAHRATRP